MDTTTHDTPQPAPSGAVAHVFDAGRAVLDAALAAGRGDTFKFTITVEMVPPGVATVRAATSDVCRTFRPWAKKTLLVDCIGIFAKRGQAVRHFGLERGIAGRREYLPEPLNGLSDIQLQKTVEHAIKDGRLIKRGADALLDVVDSGVQPIEIGSLASAPGWTAITVEDVAIYRAEMASRLAVQLSAGEAGR